MIQSEQGVPLSQEQKSASATSGAGNALLDNGVVKFSFVVVLHNAYLLLKMSPFFMTG